MKAVLLCAGYATRLYPLTENQPKALLPVGGKPILEHLFEKIEVLGSVDQIFIVTNDKFYTPFEKWADGGNRRKKIQVVNDGTRTNDERLGAIGDLVLVLKKFKIRDDVGVFAGDNLFDSDFESFFSFARGRRPHASIGVVEVPKGIASRYGIVRVDAENRITEFYEKPEKPLSNLASTGVYWFAKEGLDFLDRYIGGGHNADRPGDYVRWLVEVDQVFAYPFEGKWFDIGDFESYREAERYFQKGSSTL